MENKEIRLQYFNETDWIECGKWYNENLAWASLGGDDINYRTIDKFGNVLTDKRMAKDGK